MGAGASSEEEKDTDKVAKLRLKDDLKKSEQEIAVLKQKIGNLKSDLIRERQEKESKNVTNITTTECMVPSRLKIFWYEDYQSFRVVWLSQELEARVEKDFIFDPDIHEQNSGKEGQQNPKANIPTERENTRSTTSSQHDITESETQRTGEKHRKNSVKNKNTNTAERESSKVSKSSQGSHAKTAPDKQKSGKDKQNSNLSKSEDMPTVNPHGNVLALVGPNFKTMLQSSAICMYIAEKYGQLVPAIKYRSKYYEVILFAANSLDVLLDDYTEYWIRENKTSELKEKIQNQFMTSMAYLSNRLQNEKPYICGKNFTVADCIIGCNLHYLHTASPESNIFNKFPEVETYLRKLRERKNFIASQVLMGK